MKAVAYCRRHAARLVVSLSFLALLVLNSVGVVDLGFMQRLENYTYDTRLLWTMPGGVDKRIVILDIDEQSLKEQGHWPWPRNRLAQMMDQLFDHYQIDVLGFDVVFAERDGSSGLASLEQVGKTQLRGDRRFAQVMDELRPQLQYDQLFANSLKNRRVVMGYYFRHDQQTGAGVGQLPAPVLPQGSFNPAAVGAVVASGYTANLPEQQQAAASGGFFNASPLVDSDGVYRRAALLQMYGGALYESLGLAVARLALREPAIELVYEQGDHGDWVALESLKLGMRRVPLDAEAAALVPFRGRQGSFVYVSASDVLQAKVDPALLRGAIVLVGTTAPGLLDLRTTPMKESYPGVEVHANMVAGILDGDIKERPAYTLGLEFVLLLVVGLGLAFALPALSPQHATVLMLGVITVLVMTNLYAWQQQHLILPLASGLALALGLFVFNMSYGYFVDSRAKRQLARLFGQYVPTELVAEMARDPQAYSLSGENRMMTVLFSDVRGFTTISEGLDPQQLTALMNEFLTPMTRIIHRNRGTIDKYMGDAIMAFWGAPVADADHARHALEAALEMVASLRSLDEAFKARGWPQIRIGVGLNTGEMTVGNMGSEFRLAYTVMGDAVNLGSRLESLTKEYGVQIMVSEFTRDAVPDHAFRELDWVRVKGKDLPVKIFEPLGPASALGAAQQQELALHAQALALYRAQDWEAAARVFADLVQREPERALYRIYVQRVADFAVHAPPLDWDGTYNFQHK